MWKAHAECTKLVDKLEMFKYAEPGEGLTQDDFVEHIFQAYDRLTEVDGTTSFKEKLNYLIETL